MARVTVEDCIERVPNRFSLVHLAMRRAKQLLSGASPLVECNNKSIVVALREISQGKVDFEDISKLSNEAETELLGIGNRNIEDFTNKKQKKDDLYTVELSGADLD